MAAIFVQAKYEIYHNTNYFFYHDTVFALSLIRLQTNHCITDGDFYKQWFHLLLHVVQIYE